jgi:hypothetical protein
MRSRLTLAGISLAFICSCSSAQGTWGGTGGGAGGELDVQGSGGLAEGTTGGVGNPGGMQAAGGQPATGGQLAAGGVQMTGGTGQTGGTAVTAGGQNTGGVGPTGGTEAAGGTQNTGGTEQTGGTQNTGGVGQAGGSEQTGGSAAAGGTQNTGGTEQTGGTQNTGGTGGTPEVNCDRAGLEAAVDSYLAALEAGNPSLMPLAASVTYEENMASVDIGQGVFAAPVTIDFHRNLLDVQRCGSFTEVICASNSPQYVLGVRLQVADSEITEIEVVVTDSDDWLFDADAYLQYSTQEDWSVVPEAERLPYAELADAGYSYFRYWGDKSEPVPWGDPCARLEGGAYTRDMSLANGSCSVGVPDQSFAPQPYDDLTDVDFGMTVVLLNLGGADSHLLRVLQSGIRYVHTLTATNGSM